MDLFGPKLQLLIIIPPNRFQEIHYQELHRACKESKIRIIVTGINIKTPMEGMNGLKVKPDIYIGDVEIDKYHGAVIIGGLGIRDLINNEYCKKICRKSVEFNRVIGGIELAPLVMAHSEILSGKKATIHPTEESHLISAGAEYKNQSVVVDGLVITARDNNSAAEFADTIAGAILKLGIGKTFDKL